MIERLTGTLLHVLPGGIIVDVNGVGYGVDMPLTALCQLPEKNSQITVWTYTYVREDALKLFGFLSYDEKYFFQILIGLSGIGPKTALNILSHLSVDAIKGAVIQGQAAVFEMVPGVGGRLSEKILLELKAKLKRLIAAPRVDDKTQTNKAGAEKSLDTVWEDLRSALENLGYKDKQIEPLMRKIASQKDAFDMDFSALIKLALKELNALSTLTQASKPSVSSETDLF